MRRAMRLVLAGLIAVMGVGPANAAEVLSDQQMDGVYAEGLSFSFDAAMFTSLMVSSLALRTSSHAVLER